MGARRSPSSAKPQLEAKIIKREVDIHSRNELTERSEGTRQISQREQAASSHSRQRMRMGSSQAEAQVTGKAIKLNAACVLKNESSLLKSLALRKGSSVASSVGSNEAGTKFSNNLRNSLSKTDCPNKGNLILN